MRHEAGRQLRSRIIGEWRATDNGVSDPVVRLHGGFGAEIPSGLRQMIGLIGG
jgi:hypothetical protein